MHGFESFYRSSRQPALRAVRGVVSDADCAQEAVAEGTCRPGAGCSPRSMWRTAYLPHRYMEANDLLVHDCGGRGILQGQCAAAAHAYYKVVRTCGNGNWRTVTLRCGRLLRLP